MFTHPDLTSQLAREHRRQMQAAATSAQLQRQQRHQAAIPGRRDGNNHEICHLAGTLLGAAALTALWPHQSSHQHPAHHHLQRVPSPISPSKATPAIKPIIPPGS